MSNMKNFGGFLDNYIKKYGNTAEQDKYVTGLINAKGYEVNTFIYVKKSINYYCYKIGAIIDNDPEGDGLVRMCVNIPYAFEGKKIRTKPTFWIIISKTLFNGELKMNRSQFDFFLELEDSILCTKNLDRIKDAVFYMEYVDKLVKKFADIINTNQGIV